MLTNLIASVVITLTTNVTERFPMHDAGVTGINTDVLYVQDGGKIIDSITPKFLTNSLPTNPPGVVGGIDCVYRPYMVPDADPHQKWVRTTVKRVTVVTFNMDGKPFTASSDEIVSDTEVEYALERKENWVKK